MAACGGADSARGRARTGFFEGRERFTRVLAANLGGAQQGPANVHSSTQLHPPRYGCRLGRACANEATGGSAQPSSWAGCVEGELKLRGRGVRGQRSPGLRLAHDVVPRGPGSVHKPHQAHGPTPPPRQTSSLCPCPSPPCPSESLLVQSSRSISRILIGPVNPSSRPTMTRRCGRSPPSFAPARRTWSRIPSPASPSSAW